MICNEASNPISNRRAEQDAVHYITCVSFVYKEKEISRHDDLHERSTTLVFFCIWFLLQRAFRRLQKGWKDEADFDSTVDSISFKTALSCPFS